MPSRRPITCRCVSDRSRGSVRTLEPLAAERLVSDRSLSAASTALEHAGEAYAVAAEHQAYIVVPDDFRISDY
ncbi:protein of unknown function [Burkholderia multivorans]